MDVATLQSTARRIGEDVRYRQAGAATVVMHGGEPLLLGKELTKVFLDELYAQVPDWSCIAIGVQTNGVLLDTEWSALFAAYNVGVGVSVDGTPSSHDRTRVNFAGRGSYDAVRRGIEVLKEHHGRWGTLTVIDPTDDGEAVYDHIRSLAPPKADFLLPDLTWDDQEAYDSDQLTQYLIDLFDHWIDDSHRIRVRMFESILKVMLGRESSIDSFGTGHVDEVTIEADGAIEPLDVLRSCRDGLTLTDLNVHDHPINDIQYDDIFAEAVVSARELHATCSRCSNLVVCGGGYLPHRWSDTARFHNPSVHCRSLYRLIDHVRATFRAPAEAYGTPLVA